MKHVLEYADHAAYLEHQAIKTADPEVIARFAAMREKRIIKFSKAFAFLREFFPAGGNTLCLGARYGEEVAAFRSMGWAAIGVDLHHYSDLVIVADFHRLPWPTGWFDLVFSNAIDHVNDMQAFTAEIRRVLRPDGWVFVQLFFRDKDFGMFDCLRLKDDAEFAAEFPGFETAYRVENDGRVWLLLHRTGDHE